MSDSAPLLLFRKYGPVWCCFKMNSAALFKHQKRLCSGNLSAQPRASSYQRSAGPGERKMLSLIFNTNSHIPASKALCARVTHLALVLFRTGTCSAALHFFPQADAKLSMLFPPHIQRVQVRGLMPEAQN